LSVREDQIEKFLQQKKWRLLVTTNVKISIDKRKFYW
jgi:hypothetical protein